MTTEAGTTPERVATLEEVVKHLATKEDINDLRVELKEDINDLRVELKGDISDLRVEFKVDMAELKVLIERGQVNNTRWTVATIIAVGAIAVAVAALV